jgi:hypothetical protein
LIGRRSEVVIALASLASFEQDSLLTIFIDLADHLAGLKVPRHGAQWHLEYDILAALAGAECTASALPIISENMLAVFEVEQSPKLFIAYQYDVATTTAITTIGATLADKFFTVKVGAARSSMA